MDPVDGKIFKHQNEETVIKAVEAQEFLSSYRQVEQQETQGDEQLQKTDKDYLKDLLYGLYPDGSLYSDTLPMNPPTPPSPEELAELKMSDKKARQKQYKQAQEMYEARQQTWAELVAERKQEDHRAEIAKEKAEYEKERRQKKETLMDNPVVQEALSKINSLTDEKEKFAAIKEFLKTAATELLNDEHYGPGVTEECGITADYTEITTGLKIAVGENITNDEATRKRLHTNLEGLELKYLDLQERNVNLRAISFELTEIFREEFATLPDFARAENDLQEEYQRDLGAVQAEYSAFEPEVTKRLGLTQDQVSKYFKKNVLDDYRLKLKEAMEEFALDYTDAEEYVLRNMREEMLKECKEQSMGSNLEGDKCTEEIWEKSGAATYHRVMPAGDAQKIVEQSGGFLCAVKYGTKPGMVELKPSLPETLIVNSKPVKLRESYNTTLKKFMGLMFNEDGSLTEKARKYSAQFTYLINGDTLDKLDADFVEDMGHELLADFIKITRNQDGSMVGETDFISVTASLERAMVLQDKDHPDYQTIRARLSSMKIPAVDENGDVLYTKDANPQVQYIDLSDEKNAHYIDAAIEACIRDAEKAKIEMMRIRSMDPKSPQVPIINACSANARYIRDLKKLKSNETGIQKDASTIEAESISKRLVFHDMLHYYDRQPSNPNDAAEKEQIKKQKADAIARLNKGIEFQILGKFNSIEDYIKTLSDYPQIKNINDLKKTLSDYSNYLIGKPVAGYEEKDISLADKLLNQCAFTFQKYEYHMAAPVNQVGDLTYTTEGFAAETTQFMVEPFTFHAAIGAYKGDVTSFMQSESAVGGMVDYYKLDDPFSCNAEGLLKMKIKDIFKELGTGLR